MASRSSPPRAAELVASLLLPAAIRDVFLGDLRERFAAVAAARGRGAARRWYWRQVLRIRPWLLRRVLAGGAGMGAEGRGGGMSGGAWGMDLRQALRGLRLRPAASAMVALTLALAVGATTAVFTVVDSVLLRPLPYPEPDRLVRVWQTKGSWMDSPRYQLRAFATHYPFSVPTFEDFQASSREFSDLGAFAGAYLTIPDGGRTELVWGERVTSGLFRALGVEPLLGRYLLPEDDQPGAAPVIVLSYGTWRDRYGSDPAVVGRRIHAASGVRTVIGVMPPGFTLPGKEDAFWVSLTYDKETGKRNNRSYQVIGRLRPGSTLETARAEMAAIARGLAEAYPSDQGDVGTRLENLLDSEVGDVRTTLWLLLGSVGLVLIIACVNIANLLSVMGLSRRRELAVKAALGAGGGRLVRGRLAESLLLVGVGGLAGVAMAYGVLPLLSSILPPSLPRRDAVSMNGAVLLFGLGVTALTAVLVGLVPAVQAGRIDPARSLGEAGRGLSGGRAAVRLRGSLVVAEVALAFVLLVGAGLLANSFVRLWHVDRGFDAEGLVEAVVIPDRERYPERADRERFVADLRGQLRAIPGVKVSAATQVPLSGSASSTTYFVDRPAAPPDSAAGVLVSAVLDDYFAVMRIPVVAGRAFQPSDVADATPVAMVNEAMAREYWPGESALGRRIKRRDEEWRTVVGVAANVHHQGLDTPAEPKVYLPNAQSPQTVDSWVVRAQGDPGSVVELIRDAVARVSPDAPVWRIQVLEEHIASSVAIPRFRAIFLVGLAGMAAVLALLGVYGVTTFAVSQRTTEIGVRMALGSDSRGVVRSVIAGGLRLTALGLVLGILVAIPASRLVSSFLFQVEPADPPTFAVIVALVASVSALAAYLPARRAASVDPVEVLRSE